MGRGHGEGDGKYRDEGGELGEGMYRDGGEEHGQWSMGVEPVGGAREMAFKLDQIGLQHP